ncbi:MAG: N-acetyltransferase, partial [Chitinophagaceae bacterium]
MHFPIHYKQISRPGDGHIDAALALYHMCFPSVERQPDAVIRERVSSGLASLTVGLLNDEVACFAITWSFQHPAVNFLDYLAVDPRYRASGYGSGLLKFLEQQYKINNEYLVLEVEHPGFGNNKEERIKRISFYQKAGAVICSD